MGCASAASPSAGCAAHWAGRRAIGTSRPGRAAAGPPRRARGARADRRQPLCLAETRGPQLTLLGAIDDATSEILALQFRPAKDIHGYTALFQQLFTQHGLPVAVYGDRLTLLVRNDRHWSVEEELAGRQFPTDVGRMLQDLGIAYIAAHSPQAKGRIERPLGDPAGSPRE